MTDWATVFLGAIAVATIVMAIIQVAIIIIGLRLARRLDGLASRVEQELKPALERLTAISQDAARVSSLALGQAERLNALFTDLGRRIDDSLGAMHRAVLVPALEGAALIAAIKSVIQAHRPVRGRSGRGAEEDDPLFIG